MTLDKFLNKYFGKKIDFDGMYGAQCVDLFRRYCNDVFNFPHTGSVEGAKEIYLNYDKMPLEKKYFDRKKTIDSKCGDVVVFDKTDLNKYGHIAIFISWIEDDKHMLVFEQDGFKQDGAKFSIRNIDNALGVLKAKEKE